MGAQVLAGKASDDLYKTIKTMIITIKKGDKMSYCRGAIRVLSGDGPVMVAAEYRRKQDI